MLKNINGTEFTISLLQASFNNVQLYKFTVQHNHRSSWQNIFVFSVPIFTDGKNFGNHYVNKKQDLKQA